MNIRYFHETDFSALKGWTILLDYEGTLVAPASFDQPSLETETVLNNLKEQNSVFICSNREEPEGFSSKYKVSWLKLIKQKPDPDSISEFIKTAKLPILVIGDSYSRDGLLAEALHVPYIQVATLGKKKDSQSLQKGLVPSVISDPENEKISIATIAPSHFYENILFELKNQKQYKKIEILSDELSKLGFKIQIDPPKHINSGIVFVPWATNALSFALERKRAGFVSRIIAGPFFDTSKPEIQKLLQNPEIDLILISDELEKERLVKSNQFFEKSVVWSFGVSDFGIRRTPYGSKNECRIIASGVSEKDFKQVIEVLWRKEISISGNALNKNHKWMGSFGQVPKATYALVFNPLVTSEELMQLWMADIPTIVFSDERNLIQIPSVCGKTFSKIEEFEARLADFIEDLPTYQPREFAKIEGSTDCMARKLAQIIRERF